MEDRYLDSNGLQLAIGDRVTFGDHLATVTSFEGPDADCDEDGPVYFPPLVHITFDNGGTEHSRCHSPDAWSADWQADDLTLILSTDAAAVLALGRRVN